jgi:hypothetical protein
LNKPSIPTATSDLQNDSGFITLSDVPAQVNSDWDAVSGPEEILNKPTPKTLTAGSNISITETASTITIDANVPASGGATWTYAEATTGAYVSSNESKIYIPLTSSFPEKIGPNLYYIYFRAPLKEPPSEDDNYIIEVNVGAAYGNAVLYLSSTATEVYGRIVIAGNRNSAPPTTPYYLVLNAGYRLKFTVTGTISGNVYMLN